MSIDSPSLPKLNSGASYRYHASQKCFNFNPCNSANTSIRPLHKIKKDNDALTWISVQLRGQPSVGVIHSFGAAEKEDLKSHITEAYSQRQLKFRTWNRISKCFPTCSPSPRTWRDGHKRWWRWHCPGRGWGVWRRLLTLQPGQTAWQSLEGLRSRITWKKHVYFAVFSICCPDAIPYI